VLSKFVPKRNDVLLEVDGSGESLPENYKFLSGKYEKCYIPDPAGQGSCNSCWAFSIQKMFQARICKWNMDSNSAYPVVRLSPLGLLCGLQGNGLCAPKALGDALDFVHNVGLLSIEATVASSMVNSNVKRKYNLT
jgi:hypothetical protein